MISKKVLITPEIFPAFMDSSHPQHEQTINYFKYFAKEQFQLYTSFYSLLDNYLSLQKNPNPLLPKNFLRTFLQSSIEILYPDEATTKAAYQLLLAGSQPDLDFEEALLNTLASRHNISQIFSYKYSSFFFGIKPFSLPY